MSFIARSVPSERDDDSRGMAALPSPAPADPFFSALVDLLAIDELNTRQNIALKHAHKACSSRNADSLRLHLALIRVNADMIKTATLAMDAKFAPPDDYENSPQVYGA